jgi:hypothetical protein
MASSEQVRSLDIVFEELRTERDQQLHHFDALDQKAGIVLGFAGALVALAPGGSDVFLSFRAGGRSGQRLPLPLDVLAASLLKYRPQATPGQVSVGRAIVHQASATRYTDQHDRAESGGPPKQGTQAETRDVGSCDRRLAYSDRAPARLTPKEGPGDETHRTVRNTSRTAERGITAALST